MIIRTLLPLILWLLPVQIIAHASTNSLQHALLTLASEELREITPEENDLLKLLGEHGRAFSQDKPRLQNAGDETRLSQIRGEFLSWLLTSKTVQELIAEQRLIFRNMQILGYLDLAHRECVRPLVLENCAFENPIDMSFAKLTVVDMINCKLKGILGYGIHVTRYMRLGKGTTSSGAIHLIAGTFDGELAFQEFSTEKDTGDAIELDRATVGILAFLKSELHGGVSLKNTKVGGNLTCSGTLISRAGFVALNLEDASIEGIVSLENGFTATGQVVLARAQLGGLHFGTNATLRVPEGIAIYAPGLITRNMVKSEGGLQVEGSIDFRQCVLSQGIMLTGASIRASGPTALDLSHGTLGLLRFKNVEIDGGRLLAEALTVNGPFVMESSRVTFIGNHALQLGSTKVADHLLLMNCKLDGGMQVLGANVQGNFIIAGGYSSNRAGGALIAQHLNVEQSVQLKYGFVSDGNIDLRYARIGDAFLCEQIRIGSASILDLRDLRVRLLADEPKSWPGAGNLYLAGLQYDGFSEEPGRSAIDRKAWIGLQPTNYFTPQPYEQLARVLNSHGQNEEATEVLIAKEEAFYKYGELSWFASKWHWMKGSLGGYGYKPLNALRGILLFVAVGWFVFRVANRKGLMEPTNEKSPQFYPLLYSLDCLIPIIGFGHKDHWRPRGVLWLFYHFIHIVMGWLLTPWLIIGLTRLAEP